jgi:AcrR family transcriptional regulator
MKRVVSYSDEEYSAPVSRRPPNADRRRSRSRDAILRAGYELCQEIGYGRMTMDAIAARAGVGKQTIYRWWPSKAALTLDVFIDKTVNQITPDDTGDALDDLRRRLLKTVEVFTRSSLAPHLAAVIGEAQHNHDIAKELAKRLVVPARSEHREILLAAQRKGEVRDDLDVEILLDTLFGPIWFRFLVTKQDLTPEYAASVFDLITAEWRPGSRTPPVPPRLG